MFTIKHSIRRPRRLVRNTILLQLIKNVYNKERFRSVQPSPQRRTLIQSTDLVFFLFINKRYLISSYVISGVANWPGCREKYGWTRLKANGG